MLDMSASVSGSSGAAAASSATSVTATPSPSDTASSVIESSSSAAGPATSTVGNLDQAKQDLKTCEGGSAACENALTAHPWAGAIIGM